MNCPTGKTPGQNTIPVKTDNQTATPPQGSPNPPVRQPLVVVGASVRAIAESAFRAGHDVHAADLFGDRDLRAIAHSYARAVPYPDVLPQLVAGFPPGPWLYTGGLENHPAIIAAISRHRPLAGCAAPAVLEVRDPTQLGILARRAGLRYPETHLDPAAVPRDGSWLVKPRRSAGGHGISRWRGWLEDIPPYDHWLWQRNVPGRPWSAAFVIADGHASLIGVSRQLIGCHWTGARPFHWSGGLDVAPASLPQDVREILEGLGRELSRVAGLVGLVGVDLIIDRQLGLTLLEINPRPTASMELIERATGFSLATAQLAAGGHAPPGCVTASPVRQRTWAKAVLFAASPLVIDGRSQAALDTLACRWTAADGQPAVADLPLPPQTIPGGRPICTVFATGPSPAAALRQLRRRVQTLRQRLCA